MFPRGAGEHEKLSETDTPALAAGRMTTIYDYAGTPDSRALAAVLICFDL